MPPSRIFAAAPRRRAATAAVARLMNALCKYYFCLCTRQLSATLVLINNAKQSARATGSWRCSLPERLDMLRRVYLLGSRFAGCVKLAPPPHY